MLLPRELGAGGFGQGIEVLVRGGYGKVNRIKRGCKIRCVKCGHVFGINSFGNKIQVQTEKKALL